MKLVIRSFAVLAVALSVPVADAGVELRANDGPAGVVERRHQRAVKLRPLWAEITDRHTFAGRPGRPRQLVYRFDLPVEAAVTGLSVTIGGKRYRAVGIDAEASLRRVPDGAAAGASPDLALLREIEPLDPPAGEPRMARYELTVFPVGGAQALDVAIEWVVATSLADGRIGVHIPARGDGANLAATELSVTTRTDRSVSRYRELTINGASAASTRLATATIAPSARNPTAMTAAVEFRAAARLDIDYVPLQLAPGIAAVALAGVAAPPRTTDTTVDQLLLVVDISRSMGRDGAAAAAALTDSILATVELGTGVEVITFDRQVRRVFGSFIANGRRARAGAAAAMPLTGLRNGSNLGLALEEVGKALDSSTDAPPKTAAVIVVTDGVTPIELDAASVSRRVGAAANGGARFFAVNIAPEGVRLPRPLAGALTDLVDQSGGAGFAVRVDVADARGREIARRLGAAARHSNLAAFAFGARAGGLGLPDRIAPGSGFLAVSPWIGATPAGLSVRGRRGGRAFEHSASRGSAALAEVSARLMLRRLDRDSLRAAIDSAASPSGPQIDGSVNRTISKVLADVALARPVATPFVSLVIPSPQGRFGRSRVELARRWGSQLYWRVPTPHELSGAIDLKLWRGASARRPQVGPRSAKIGTLDPITVRRELRDQLFRPIRSCYERALRATPRLSGSMTLRLEIARDEVTVVRIAGGSVWDAAMRSCVVEAGYQFRPPRVQGDAGTVYVIRYPFRFRVRERGGATIDEGEDTTTPTEPDQSDPLDGID